MAKTGTFPLLIRNQSVVVKIYREKAKSNKDGFGYCVTWVGPNGRERKTVSDLIIAKETAELKASQLAVGLGEGQLLDRSDVMELHEARLISEGVPLLSALREWKAARDLAGPAVLEACSRWAEQRTSTIQRIKIESAVRKFISAKDAVGKQGSATYESKLKPIMVFFPDLYLDTLTTQQWTKYLNQFEDAVTRNDLRKRAITLCRWAQRNGHLSDAIKPEVEKTERAKEVAKPIGILEPKEYLSILNFFRLEHPEYLAAVILAGFCGLRADEIQGKRADRSKRQLWEDIHIDRKFLSVTAAKENTPSSRVVPLSPVAVQWLRLCSDRSGPVCAAAAMERVREIAKTAGFRLPENCFRHSYITYRIALTGDKPKTSTEAGNSVKEIDRRYRVPRPKESGKNWFNLFPSA